MDCYHLHENKSVCTLLRILVRTTQRWLIMQLFGERAVVSKPSIAATAYPIRKKIRFQPRDRPVKALIIEYSLRDEIYLSPSGMKTWRYWHRQLVNSGGQVKLLTHPHHLVFTRRFLHPQWHPPLDNKRESRHRIVLQAILKSCVRYSETNASSLLSSSLGPGAQCGPVLERVRQVEVDTNSFAELPSLRNE